MPVARSELVDARRGLLALALAVGSTAFNWGSEVTTPTGAVAWFGVSLVLGYLTLTVIDLVAARVWGRRRR
jgi:predicted phage gp36 major capsid-like protein